MKTKINLRFTHIVSVLDLLLALLLVAALAVACVPEVEHENYQMEGESNDATIVNFPGMWDGLYDEEHEVMCYHLNGSGVSCVYIGER